MKQTIWVADPIPSCPCSGCRFENGSWSFAYEVETPVELSDDIKTTLYVYSHISNLKLCSKDDINPSGCNISISCLSEYISYLDRQREWDLEYRRRWLMKNPDREGTENIITSENRNYTSDEMFGRYLVRPLEIGKISTRWIGV